MKNTICKRLTGVLLSLSMLGASLCSVSYATDTDLVSTKVDLTGMYNTALEKDANGNFSLNSRGISVSHFKAETEKYQWKEAWTEGKTDNTMLFNGKEYYINNVTADGTGKALFRTFEMGNNGLRRLDVVDGLYQSISFLASGNQEAPELAVRFNYTDGESSRFFTRTVPYYTNRNQTEPDIAFAAINGAGEISYERYFREYTFDEIDSDRVLASIDILPADWEIGEDGTASKSENTLSRLYDVFILGIDLQTNVSLQNKYEDIRSISVNVDFSGVCNTKLETGYALTNHGIDTAKFKAESAKWQWKEAWTEGKTDNVMILGEHEYAMKSITPDGMALIRTYNGKNELHNIDVEDGLYQSISFLAGNGSTSKLAVRFNYKDGSSPYYTERVFPWTGVGAIQPDYQQLLIETVSSSGSTGNRRFTELVFNNIDSSRILTSIDILPGHWDVDENGNAVQQDNVPANRQCDLFILGIDLQTNKALQKAFESQRSINAAVDFSGACNTKLETGYALTTHGIDVEKFKAESAKWQWKEAWTEGKTDNVMILGEHEYAMRNITPDGMALIRTYNGKDELHNIDVEDGFYQSISFLAGNGSPSKLAVRFNYKDGSSQYYTKEILRWLEFDPANKQIVIDTVSGSGSTGNRRFTELVFNNIDSSRILTSIDILPGHWDVDENGNAVQQENIPANRQCDLYILGIGMHTNVAATIQGVIAAIDNLPQTITEADKEVLAIIKNRIEFATVHGAKTENITNYSKYLDAVQALGQFVEIEDVSVSVNSKTAEVIFTFDMPIGESVFNSAQFKLMKNGVEIDRQVSAVVADTNKIKVSFEHSLDYEAEWGVHIIIGNIVDYKQLVALQTPISLDNAVFKDKDGSSIYNFYEGKTYFSLKADIVNEYNMPGSILLGLYDENNSLQAVQSVDASEKTLELTFDSFNGVMTSDWDLKIMVWDSALNMSPVTLSKSMKKTYGYENVIDISKPLKIAYFGDSQTQGGRFTIPLTEMFEAQRGAEKITAVNLGVGGTSSFLGMYRLDDVINEQPDIVFVEFTPNDGKTSPIERIVPWNENIIKRLNDSAHVPVIIYMNPMKEVVYEDIGNTIAVGALKGLLEHYNIPLMDFNVYARQKIDEGTWTWDQLRVSDMDVHFTSEGGRLCAEWMWNLLMNEQSTYARKPSLNTANYQQIQYKKPYMISSIYGKYDNNWSNVKVESFQEGYWQERFDDSFPEGFMAAKEIGATMKFKFKGSAVNLYTLIGNTAGAANYSIDNGLRTGVINSYTTNSLYRCTKTIVHDLPYGEHEITITVIEPDSRITDETARENAIFGIGYFLVDEI